MIFMKLLQGLASLFLAAVLSAPAWASNNASSNSAVPGTLNYVEGQVSVADQSVDHNSIGKSTLEVGQSLNTENGKAEILLIPGVFLRAGDNSSVKMIAAGLTNTELSLDQGHIMIEVDQIYPQNELRVDEGGASAKILKPGLYDFDLQHNQIRVFDGEATVQEGDKQIKLKAGHELALAPSSAEKTQKFDKKASNGDDLYRWSSLRSDYVAEANVDAARLVAADGWAPGYWGSAFWGPGWGWGGWYWDPWFSAFTFLPGGGIFYSPFGWGFYSPAFVFRAPFSGAHFFHTFNAASVHAWGPGQHYAGSRAYSHGVCPGADAKSGSLKIRKRSASALRFLASGFRLERSLRILERAIPPYLSFFVVRKLEWPPMIAAYI